MFIHLVFGNYGKYTGIWSVADLKLWLKNAKAKLRIINPANEPRRVWVIEYLDKKNSYEYVIKA